MAGPQRRGVRRGYKTSMPAGNYQGHSSKCSAVCSTISSASFEATQAKTCVKFGPCTSEVALIPAFPRWSEVCSVEQILQRQMEDPVSNETSVTDELNHWGFKPCCRCYCGCNGETDSYFMPGHDAYFAPRLLATLRGDQNIADAIRQLVRRGGAQVD